MQERQVFHPKTNYWIRWGLVGISILIVVITGINENTGTATHSRAIGFSIVLVASFVGLLLLNFRRQIIITPKGLFIQTIFRTYYWPWTEIISVNFYLSGQNSENKIFIGTEPKNYSFEIDVFDAESIEDCITDYIGDEQLGAGAYRRSEKYKQAEQEEKRVLQRYGDPKKYIGGWANDLLYIYITIWLVAFSSIAFLLGINGSWLLASLFLLLGWIGFIRPLTFAGQFYMSRDHIIFKHWFYVNMMWWRDVETVEIDLRFIVFRGRNQCLVCPGPILWRKEFAQKLSYVFHWQLETRQISYQPAINELFFPFNRNVKTKRFDRKISS